MKTCDKIMKYEINLYKYTAVTVFKRKNNWLMLLDPPSFSV